MTALVLDRRLPPDDPLRRLKWILPLAVLLVLLGLFAAGHWLSEPNMPKAHKPRPVDARIYELPASPGSRPASPKPRAEQHRRIQPVKPPTHSSAVSPEHPHPARAIRMPKAKASVPKAAHDHEMRRPIKARQPAATASKRRKLDWANLTSQIDSVASSVVSHSAFAQVHDPHSLVARYYLRALLEKLQHTGDMVYAGEQTGSVEVRMIIGSDGTVQALEIDGYDGASGLTRVARHIVDLSAPFSPFPASLLHKTRRLKLAIHMKFLGYHNVNAQ